MSGRRTLSPEMDTWLASRRANEGAVAQASELWKEPGEKDEPRRTSPAWTHDVELTDLQWRWLWKRFQPVGTPSIGFARRLQTSTTDVMSFSPEQRAWVLALAFKYRRKVFFNPRAAALDCAQFVAAIRALAK